MGCTAPEHCHRSRQHNPGMQQSEIIQQVVRLVAMGAFLSIVLCFPEKGHTHGPLDGCFEQMCVKLSLAEFDDDMDVVSIPNEFLISSGLDGVRGGSSSLQARRGL